MDLSIDMSLKADFIPFFMMSFSFLWVYLLRVSVENVGGVGIRILNNIKVIGANNQIVFEGDYRCRNNKLHVHGSNNRIIVRDANIHDSKITIMGCNNDFIIEKNGHIRSADILLSNDGNEVTISKNFNSGLRFVIQCLEGRKITIGEDCMFSTDCEIWTSDAHSIFDDKGNRINTGQDVRIGDHVWFGKHVVCMKGTEIPNGCMVGHSSLCTKGNYEENGLYAGIPARKIRGKIRWEEPR